MSFSKIARKRSTMAQPLRENDTGQADPADAAARHAHHPGMATAIMDGTLKALGAVAWNLKCEGRCASGSFF